MISDNARSFTAWKVQNFMKTHRIKWKSVVQYVHKSNGKAERMFGTINQAIKQTPVQSGMHWSELVKQVVYGYRRQSVRNGHFSFYLMYWTQPHVCRSEHKSLLTRQPIMYSRIFETLAAQWQRPQNAMKKKDHVSIT